MKTPANYEVKNTIPGMSDDDFYGRDMARDVDFDLVKLAAIQEARCAYDQMVMSGEYQLGAMMLRRAAARLSLAWGNQSKAERYLFDTDLPALLASHTVTPTAAEEMEKAVSREFAHPELAEHLKRIEAKIAEYRAASN